MNITANFCCLVNCSEKERLDIKQYKAFILKDHLYSSIFSALLIYSAKYVVTRPANALMIKNYISPIATNHLPSYEMMSVRLHFPNNAKFINLVIFNRCCFTCKTCNIFGSHINAFFETMFKYHFTKKLTFVILDCTLQTIMNYQ